MNSTLENVRLAGICAAVPKQEERILESDYSDDEGRHKFVRSTGIERRRISAPDQWCSDFACAAAEGLIDELGWASDEIGLVIFVTQSADMKLPATACIIQDRLGLSRDCGAFDVNLGCSGYTYGLKIAGSLLSARGIRKALLLVGDTSGKRVVPARKQNSPPLFGDAATATALEWREGAAPMLFDLKTDGSGWEAIHELRTGGRPPVTEEKFGYEVADDGSVMIKTQFGMSGEDVFNFSVREVPLAVQALLDVASTSAEEVDFFVFHQANRMINDFIRKRLKLDESRVPSTLAEFGNTSSATIPLTIVSRLRERLRAEPATLLLCGFGVGLSWATVLCKTDGIVCPELVEL